MNEKTKVVIKDLDRATKDEESYYFHRVKHIDSYGVQRLTIEEHLAEINRTIESIKNHYDEIQKEAQKIEIEIFNDSKEVKDVLRILGLKDFANIKIEPNDAYTEKKEEKGEH